LRIADLPAGRQVRNPHSAIRNWACCLAALPARW